MCLAEKKDNYNIRIAEKGDADEIYYLVQRAFSSYGEKGCSPASKETIDDIYIDIQENTVLVIEIDDRIVGTLRLISDSRDKYYLRRFSIHPNFQDQGLGTFLYYQAEKKVKETDGKYICLHSSTEDSKLIKFYNRLGFECIEKDYLNGYERGLWIKKIIGVD